METIRLYLGNYTTAANGIVALALAQDIAFCFWSQTDDFKDNVRYKGHLYAVVALVIFTAVYGLALTFELRGELAILDNSLLRIELGKAVENAPALLHHAAWREFWGRLCAVVVFGLIAVGSLARYFVGNYDERWKTLRA